VSERSEGPLVAVLDYGIGNLRSAQKALERVGADARLTADPALVADAAGVVLPGVGAFGRCMESLHGTGLADIARDAAQDGRPFLGICIGMQMLFEASEESPGAPGLGILPGTVTRLQSPRLPHIGWNLVTFERDSALTEGLGDAAAFYHVHSFACRPSDATDVVGTSEYGERFVSVVERGNVMASQFHPEKSSRDGLRMLRNFAQLAAVAVA